MKKLFNILTFVSFIFLFIYLIKQDLIIPEIPDLSWLVISILFVFAGFYASTISWRVALKSHGKKISHKDAIVSHGQAIFAKYIPGKIWVILGRAGYIAKDKAEMKSLSFISMKEQLIYIWAGLIISAVPTFIFYKIDRQQNSDKHRFLFWSGVKPYWFFYQLPMKFYKSRHYFIHAFLFLF